MYEKHSIQAALITIVMAAMLAVPGLALAAETPEGNGQQETSGIVAGTETDNSNATLNEGAKTAGQTGAMTDVARGDAAGAPAETGEPDSGNEEPAASGQATEGAGNPEPNANEGSAMGANEGPAMGASEGPAAGASGNAPADTDAGSNPAPDTVSEPASDADPAAAEATTGSDPDAGIEPGTATDEPQAAEGDKTTSANQESAPASPAQEAAAASTKQEAVSNTPAKAAAKPSAPANGATAVSASSPAKASTKANDKTAAVSASSNAKAPCTADAKVASTANASVASKTSATKPKTASATKAKSATKVKTQATATTATTGKGDLAAGRYFLVSALRNTQVIDVEGGTKANGGNVIVWHVNGGKNEQWALEVGSDGYAVIRSLLSNKVLDISGGVAKKGANVLQWTYKGSKNQKWVVSKQGKHYVVASALNSKLVLDLEGGTAVDGTNVGIWKRTNGKNQLFSFVPVKAKGTKAGTKTIKNGVYQIRPVAAKKRPVDIEKSSLKSGANAAIQTQSGAANQAFKFTYDGKGFYTITNVKSGLQLAPDAACSVAGINVSQRKLGDANIAKWKVVKSGSFYKLVNKVTGTALDLEGAKNANGTNLQTRAVGSAKSEQFTLKRQAMMPTGAVSIELLAGSKMLDVYGASLAKGAAVGTFDNQSSLNQRFLVKKYGSGYTIRPFNSRMYLTASSKNALVQDKAHKKMKNQVWKAVESKGGVVLVNADSGLALTVGGKVTRNSSGVALKASHPEKALKSQRFYLQSVPAITEGVYYIAASSDMGKVLDVENGTRTNGANVQLWKKHDTNGQRFLISSAGAKDTYYITSVASGRAVDVTGASKKSGANVEMYSANGGANQKWKIEMASDFSLRITSVDSGNRLNIVGGKAVKSANIDVRKASDKNSGQKFWLIDTDKANEVVTIGVPCYMQNPELPTGCESVALTNALRYWGFNLGKSTIANNWMPYGDDGVYNFIGNPHDDSGWIICAPGIVNTANKYLKSKGSNIVARNATGSSLMELRKYIDKGCPVVVWTTIDMGSPNGPFGTKHGYTLYGNNHAVVLTGYDPNTGRYQVADSLAGKVWRNGSSFTSLYNTMGKQAVVITD